MSHPLRIVRPLKVTPAMMISSNVVEADYPEWDIGATYAQGARVIVTAQHRVYQSVAVSNIGRPPATSPDDWAEVGATNKWKAFDSTISTRTLRGGLISYRIKPGQIIHSVSALNLAGATSIRVRMVDPSLGTIYDTTTALAGQLLISTWWDWFFGARTEPKQAVLTDIPSAPAADILIDIEGDDGLAVGTILMGAMRTFSLGAQVGARTGILDYSRKERNEWGDTVLTERPHARRATFSLLLQSSEVDSFNDFCIDVRATPCLWIGSSRFESTTVYGFYKSFDIALSYYDYANCELELEGLT